MKTTRLFPVAFLLAGCATVERMNEQNAAARVQVAALQSQAVVGAEWARTQAAASVAQSQAMSDVATTVAWSAQLPWVVGLVCLTVVILAIIWWRVAVLATNGDYAQPRILPTSAEWAAMQDFARERGGQIVTTPDGDVMLDVDGRRSRLRIAQKR